MILEKTSTSWIVHTPAKLNLFFEILRKRPDGYHEIETIMAPVSLYDTLILSQRDSKMAKSPGVKVPAIELACKFTSGFAQNPRLAADQSNLVWKAADLIQSHTGKQLPIRLELIKRIPAQAGMGGGSSDAAATLVLLNHGLELGLTDSVLIDLAAQLGSDVPFFLQNSIAKCTGRGEKIESLIGLPRMDCVIVKPSLGLSTAAVYAKCCVSSQPRTAAEFIDGMRKLNWTKIEQNIHNALQVPAEELAPSLATIAKVMKESGCVVSQLTGSGSAYFGIARSASHARIIAKRLEQRALGQVFCVQTLGPI